MKNYLTILLLTISFIMLPSCSPVVYGLRGEYDVRNYLETQSSYDDVWNRLIDCMSLNNIPIDVLDKQSGLIVSKPVDVSLSRVTQENRDGSIRNSNAWFVFPYEENCEIEKVELLFNVRVKSLVNGNTHIQINMDFKGFRSIIVGPLFMQNWQIQESPCYSTGVFEREFLNILK